MWEGGWGTRGSLSVGPRGVPSWLPLVSPPSLAHRPLLVASFSYPPDLQTANAFVPGVHTGFLFCAGPRLVHRIHTCDTQIHASYVLNCEVQPGHTKRTLQIHTKHIW